MTLQIKEGKFYRTRDGRKVGPARRHNSSGYPWHVRNWSYTNDGHYFVGEDHHNDLIAEWTDEPDIFNITEPFGMLDAATQEALKEYDGEIEFYSVEGYWEVELLSAWFKSTAYRAVPKRERETITAHLVIDKDQCQIVTLDVIDGKPDLSSIREREATQ